MTNWKRYTYTTKRPKAIMLGRIMNYGEGLSSTKSFKSLIMGHVMSHDELEL